MIVPMRIITFSNLIFMDDFSWISQIYFFSDLIIERIAHIRILVHISTILNNTYPIKPITTNPGSYPSFGITYSPMIGSMSMVEPNREIVKIIEHMKSIAFSNLFFMNFFLSNTNLDILVYLLLEEIYCMISLIAITHTTIIEMRTYPTMTVMIDPIFKPRWSMDTSHIIGIRQRAMIVKHVIKMIDPMRIIAFSNLFFMKDLLLI